MKKDGDNTARELQRMERRESDGMGERKEKKGERCPVSLNEGRWACAREGKCCWPLGRIPGGPAKCSVHCTVPVDYDTIF